MKKIINGKTYNTETATKICGYSRGRWTDFGHIEESLYRTKHGAYFIAGEGGASTKYAVWIGNMKYEGDGIAAVDEAAAKSFVEEYGTADDYIKAFGEPEEA